MGLILCKNSLQKWAQEVMITRGLKSAGDGSKEVRGGGEGGGGGGGRRKRELAPSMTSRGEAGGRIALTGRLRELSKIIAAVQERAWIRHFKGPTLRKVHFTNVF